MSGHSRSLAVTIAFVFSIGLASAAKVQHVAGTVGALGYLAVLGAVVFAGRRFDVAALARFDPAAPRDRAHGRDDPASHGGLRRDLIRG